MTYEKMEKMVCLVKILMCTRQVLVVLSRTTQGHDVRCLRFFAVRSLEENILQVSDAFVPAAEHIISRTTVNRNLPAIGLRAYHPFWMQRFTARNKVLHLEWC
jgi:hypothetical protein